MIRGSHELRTLQLRWSHLILFLITATPGVATSFAVTNRHVNIPLFRISQSTTVQKKQIKIRQ